MRTIISYEPLWKTLQEKGISQYYLLQNGLDNKTLDSLKKGKNITLLTLEKLCKLIELHPKRYYQIYLKATGVLVGSFSFSRGERSNAALEGTVETELSKVGALLAGSAKGWIIQKGGARPLPFGR